ncbi:CD151 antigen-like [Onthophagus taurus]|uniref:CD151 antigen-like n=1 Tax=Onthophagus taurus TaxID=166361 RepID=UPI0039BE7D6A
MGCSVECTKCLVIVFSIIYAIVGVASISIGVYYFTQELQILRNLNDETRTAAENIDDAAMALTWGAFLFIITGVLELVFALIGIGSAWKENNGLIKIYGILLVLMITLHLILTGLSFAKTSNENTFNETKEKMYNNFKQYLNETAQSRNVQNYFEEQYHCCGLDTYRDYDVVLEMSPIPQSCCEHKAVICDSMHQKYYSLGCYSAVTSKITFHYKTVGVVSAIVAILEVFGAVMTFYFVNTIRNEKRRIYT